MKKNNNLSILIVVLAILFFPITLLVLCFKGSSSKKPKEKDNGEITMDEIIDIEELFED